MKKQPLFTLLWMAGLCLLLSHPDMSHMPVKADIQESQTVTAEGPSFEEDPAANDGVLPSGAARPDLKIYPTSVMVSAWDTSRSTWLTTVFYQSNYLSSFTF